MKGIYEEIVRLRKLGQPAALATIIARRGSIPRKDAAKMLIRQDGSTVGTIGGGCTEGEVWREALNVIREEKAKTLYFELMEDEPTESGLLCGGTMNVYIEPILPDPVLYVFGAGHIGQSLCRFAKGVGFDVVIIDDRADYANRDKFPLANDIMVDDFENATKKLDLNRSSYIVIVTRGHRYDQVITQWAIQTEAKYIGLLGSRRKIKIIFEKLEASGIPREELKKVYCPIGIEIGSETPDEIAISIVAEMIAVRKNLDLKEFKKKKLFAESDQEDPVDLKS